MLTAFIFILCCAVLWRIRLSLCSHPFWEPCTVTIEHKTVSRLLVSRPPQDVLTSRLGLGHLPLVP